MLVFMWWSRLGLPPRRARDVKSMPRAEGLPAPRSTPSRRCRTLTLPLCAPATGSQTLIAAVTAARDLSQCRRRTGLVPASRRGLPGTERRPSICAPEPPSAEPPQRPRRFPGGRRGVVPWRGMDRQEQARLLAGCRRPLAWSVSCHGPPLPVCPTSAPRLLRPAAGWRPVVRAFWSRPRPR
jgi:hypothetical protein